MEILTIRTVGQGLIEVTDQVAGVVRRSSSKEGLCTVFVQHTSASLLIQENADPSAKRDLEVWFNQLVRELDPLYTHTYEGADDMPSHIKSALTASSLGVPYTNSCLCLGRWQGIYLWEHRKQTHQRRIVVHCA